MSDQDNNQQNNMTGMPGMPGIPALNEGLNPPAHEGSTPPQTNEQPSGLPTPTIIKPEDTISNNVKIPLVPKAGIRVKAMRKGFYAQQRILMGQEFMVQNFEQLGEWMECFDKAIERKRLEIFKNKKAKH